MIDFKFNERIYDLRVRTKVQSLIYYCDYFKFKTFRFMKTQK